MRGDKRGRRFWTEGGRTGTVSGACGVPCREYYRGGEEECEEINRGGKYCSTRGGGGGY